MPSETGKSLKRRALGKGLAALLPTAAPAAEESLQGVTQVPIAKIDPNPVQPRTTFDPEALGALAASIRADGVLQPVLVRPAGDRYTLVVGERRLKACRLAGMATVPVIVREIEPDKLLEVTLVENIQRENLNPIEIAAALDRMIADLNLIHEELAARTGMSRASITNHLRLLRLPAGVKQLIRDGKLQMGHARALLPIENAAQQESLATRAATSELSVREVERLVRQLLEPRKKRAVPKLDPNVGAAIEELERVLQAPVRLKQRGKRGRVEIDYSSPEQLAAIYDRIVGTQQES